MLTTGHEVESTKFADSFCLQQLPDLAPLKTVHHVRTYHKGTVIYAEGDPADYYYKVVLGAVRSCKYLCDGRRQISAFHIAGELFGIEHGESHRLSAEVTRQTRISIHPRSSIDADAASSREIMQNTLADLARAQSLAVVLGRKSATERVASFLLDLSNRIQRDVVELPMSRADIADHLGLTLETVSRTLSYLEREKIIRLPAPKTVFMQNRVMLEQLCDGQSLTATF